MARIDFKKFVKITSGVAGGSAASRRDLNLRLFTENAALPYGQVLTCDSADGVASVFGVNSDEYKVAVKYLGFISKSVTSPKQISFVRWAKDIFPQTYVTGFSAPKGIGKFVGKIGFKMVPYSNGSVDATKTAANLYWDIGDEAPTNYDTIAANLTTKIAVMANDSAYSWLKGAGVEYSGGKFVFNFDGDEEDYQDIRFFEYDGEEEPTIGLAWIGFAEDESSGALPTEWNSYSPYSVNAKVYHKGSAYKATTAVTAPAGVANWSGTSAYAEGSLVAKEGTLYVCNTDIEAPGSGSTNPWDPDDWDEVVDWDPESSYTGKTTGASAHNGSFVFHDGDLHECKTDIEEPAPYEKNEWDATKWTRIANDFEDGEFVSLEANYHNQYGYVDSETATEAIMRINALDDNFGMFAYMTHLSASEAKSVAAYNKTLNYKYIFHFDSKKSNFTDYGTADGKLWGYECTHGVYANNEDEYAWWLNSAILGSTDYTRANSTKTAMYYQGVDIAPSVGIKSDAIGWYKTIDAARLNYYGETMKSGSPLRFYQDGVSMNGVDTACEMNEIWFKDACETEIINLLIAMEKVPANDNGAEMISMMVDGVAREALNNGTIIKGKQLTNAEKIKVDSLFAEEGAWKTLQSNGSKFSISLSKVSVNGTQKWAAKYLLAYLMGEAIKYVEGTDLMF